MTTRRAKPDSSSPRRTLSREWRSGWTVARNLAPSFDLGWSVLRWLVSGAPCVRGGAALRYTAMLCFDIRRLESQATPVDGVLAAEDPVWGADDTRPAGAGVHVVGRLSSAGQGRFFFSGRFDGTAVTTCRRCLCDVTSSVGDELQLIFAASDTDEANESDIVPIPAGEREVDLRPVVREEWLMAVPGFALCREDCRGLCPSCGSDRNTGSCTCSPSSDPRWDGLRNVRISES